jgi:antitoxin HigA-1
MKQMKIQPVHPGEVLLEEFLKPLGLSQYQLAKGMKVYPRKINEIVHGKRSITADTALRLSRYFGTSAELWMNLQALFDLEKARDAIEDLVENEVTPFIMLSATKKVAESSTIAYSETETQDR